MTPSATEFSHVHEIDEVMLPAPGLAADCDDCGGNGHDRREPHALPPHRIELGPPPAMRRWCASCDEPWPCAASRVEALLRIAERHRPLDARHCESGCEIEDGNDGCDAARVAREAWAMIGAYPFRIARDEVCPECGVTAPSHRGSCSSLGFIDEPERHAPEKSPWFCTRCLWLRVGGRDDDLT